MRGLSTDSICRGACWRAPAAAAVALPSPATRRAAIRPTMRRPRRRSPATCARSRPIPRISRSLIGAGTSRARARRRPGRGRLLRPRRRGQSAQPAAAGRHGRGVGRERRCRRRRCPISSAPSSSARRSRRSAAIAASPTTCLASRPRRRPTIARRSAARDADEARRRLALSLAISGDQAGALAAARAAVGEGRCGDRPRPRLRSCADRRFQRRDERRINAAMPGSSSRVAPFLQRFPSLAPAQKAAAVNLGIFPDGEPAPLTPAATPRSALRRSPGES